MEEMSEYKRVYCRPSGPPDTCGLVHFGRTIYGTVGIRFPSAIVSLVFFFFFRHRLKFTQKRIAVDNTGVFTTAIFFC